MTEIISGVYKITNTLTGDFYIGSSTNVKRRWAEHKSPSRLSQYPNNPMYKDMKQYGIDKFVFEILAEVEAEHLKETEQQFIETFKPTYNSNNAKGFNIERQKKSHRKAQKKYDKSDKRKKYKKEYEKTDNRKKYKEEYNNQLCFYNGETLTLTALKTRFYRAGITHPVLEAKKYLLVK